MKEGADDLSLGQPVGQSVNLLVCLHGDLQQPTASTASTTRRYNWKQNLLGAVVRSPPPLSTFAPEAEG